MKKQVFLVAGILAGLAVFTSCVSTPASETKQALQANESGTIVGANKTYIRDWSGRMHGTEAVQKWLGLAIQGNFDEAKVHLKIDGDVLKLSAGTGADEYSAQMRASSNYARVVARELRQSIDAFAAEKARTGSMDEKTKQAIEEVTKNQSHVEITGHEKKVEFWQMVDIEDALTGKMTRKYVLYQIYVIPAKTWARTTGLYLRKVLGELPEDLTLEEKDVRGMVNEAMYDARHPVVMSQEEKRQELEYSRKMMDVQVKLAPEQQKAAAKQELIKIAQNAKTNRTKIVADAKTKQVEATADALTTIDLSGNRALRNAATITAADADWLEAMEIAMSVMP